ncbi:hypothetical protein HOH87_04595 [bacterium]|jgi:hypothetical protein|nr:hypothetical protein [bacterium]
MERSYINALIRINQLNERKTIQKVSINGVVSYLKSLKSATGAFKSLFKNDVTQVFVSNINSNRFNTKRFYFLHITPTIIRAQFRTPTSSIQCEWNLAEDIYLIDNEEKGESLLGQFIASLAKIGQDLTQNQSNVFVQKTGSIDD